MFLFVNKINYRNSINTLIYFLRHILYDISINAMSYFHMILCQFEIRTSVHQGLRTVCNNSLNLIISKTVILMNKNYHIFSIEFFLSYEFGVFYISINVLVNEIFTKNLFRRPLTPHKILRKST